MSHCVYWVWDGAVIDARRDSASRRAPPLAGLDDIAPDTGAMAFIADRGFVVLDDSVCLAHAFADYLARARSDAPDWQPVWKTGK